MGVLSIACTQNEAPVAPPIVDLSEPQESSAASPVNKEKNPDQFERLSPFTIEETTGLASTMPIHLTRAQVGTWKIPLSASKDIWVALDGHPPRKVESFGSVRQLRLTDLLNEDEELSPGSHLLSILSLSPKIVKVQTHVFALETKQADERVREKCLLLTEGLTFNGEQAADEITLWIIGLPPIEEAHVLVESERWKSETVITPFVPLQLKSPPSGDFSIVVSCQSKDKPPLGASRVITINREGPEPHSSP